MNTELLRIIRCCLGFFTNTRTCYYYASYFSVAENSTILGKIKGTDKVVAAVIPYGSGKIVLLPQIYEEEECIAYINTITLPIHRGL